MQLVTAKLPGSQLGLTFQLDAADVQKSFSKVYSELATRGQVPGFRPGKAPPALIKRRYKPDFLTEMFWMQVVEDHVQKELEKGELEVLGEPDFPDFKEIEVSETAPLEFTLTVTVRPEPQLPDYAGLKLYRALAEVTDEQVAAALEELRDEDAREQPVEGRDTVERGDLVEAEILEVTEGEEAPGESVSEALEIGSGRYEPAIDEALIGHAAGETVEVPHEYAEDHSDPGLAGKKSVFRVTIGALRARVLPELTDEWAMAQGEYENVEGLRTKLREQLERAAAEQSRRNLESDVLGALVRDTAIEIPELLVRDVASRGLRSFLEELEQAGLTLEQFEQIGNVARDTIFGDQVMRAQAGLRISFVMEALAKAEAIEVGEEAVAEEIKLFAAENMLEEDFLTQSLELQEGFREQIEDRARRRLTIAALLAKADIEDISVERYQEIKEEQRRAQEAARAAAEEAERVAAEEAERVAAEEAERAAAEEAERAAAEAEAAAAAAEAESPVAPDAAAETEAPTQEAAGPEENPAPAPDVEASAQEPAAEVEPAKEAPEGS